MTARRSQVLAAGTVAALVIGLSAVVAEAAPKARLSRDLSEALKAGGGEARDVILQADQATISAVAARHGATIKKWLATGAVLSVSGASLDAMSNDESVDHLSGDTLVRSMMAVTDPAIGADQVAAGALAGLGPITGRGVGIALIDSGVFNHKALQGRIIASFDFTDGKGKGLDELGHGTHVAGIIGGSDGSFRGVAPGASIVSLKVLSADGSGKTSDVINAIDFAIANRGRFGLRVINLSLGRPVFESYLDDPLDQAVERAYRAGLVVVTSAGNYGKTQDGAAVLGGITAPGNSPYSLTVGSLDSQGTANRSDDVVSDYSSRGPTLFDRLVKPDIAAPGRKIVSLYVPGSHVRAEVSGPPGEREREQGAVLPERDEHGDGRGDWRGGAGARGEPAARPAAGADCAADVVHVPAGCRADWRGRGRSERGGGGAGGEERTGRGRGHHPDRRRAHSSERRGLGQHDRLGKRTNDRLGERQHYRLGQFCDHRLGQQRQHNCVGQREHDRLGQHHRLGQCKHDRLGERSDHRVGQHHRLGQCLQHDRLGRCQHDRLGQCPHENDRLG